MGEFVATLQDVNLSGLTDGDTLVWNATTRQWERGTGSGVATQPGIYRVVQDYGGHVYTSQSAALAGTDSTTAIRNAIDAAVSGGGGTVVFDPGFYKVAGSLDTTRGGNAQIPLPQQALTSPKLSLYLYCHEPAAAEIYGEQVNGASAAGAILCSTLTGQTFDATHYSPSVIGGPTSNAQTPAASAFTNLYVTVHGIAVRPPDNPSVAGFDFGMVAAVDMRDFRFDTQAAPTSISQPTHAHAWALTLPKVNNNVINNVGNGTIIGSYAGMAVAEHSNGYGTVQIYKTVAPIVPLFGIHLCRMSGLISVEWCPHVIAGCDPQTGVTDVTQPSVFDVFCLDIEDAPTGSWYSPVDHIKDANNQIRGRVRYGRVIANIGYTTAALTTTGAINVKLEDIATAATVPAKQANGSTVYLTHSFSAADSVLSASQADTGQAESQLSGTWGLQAGRAYLVTSTAAVYADVWDSGHSDGQFSVDITPGNASRLDALLLFRATDNNNYLLAELAGPNNVTLFKKIGGTYTSLAATTVANFVAGQIYTLKATANGTAITVYLDGVSVLTYGSTTGQEAATKVGIGINRGSTTQDDGSSRWDNLRATSL